MNAIHGNDPELENFLLILAEHPDEKDRLYPRILKKLPWGFHPLIYIEKIKDPQTRLLIRDAISDDLISRKLQSDLITLLPTHSSDDFLIKSSFLLTFFSDDIHFGFEEFYFQLERISRPLRERLQSLQNPSELTKINLFQKYFFEDLKFKGNTEDPFCLDNHFIHRVIEKRKGGSIALCILANAIAKFAGIELPVIITASHFLLKTNIENTIPYIDPFQNGKIIREDDHLSNIAQKGYDPSVGLLQITSNLIVFQRLVRNLMQTAQNSENKTLYPAIKDFHGTLKIFINTA